jgi:hypothetical protein
MEILTVWDKTHSLRSRRTLLMCSSSAGSDAAMHEAVAAVAACGVSPVVRIPANEGWMVKRKREMLLYRSEMAQDAPRVADDPSIQEP